MDVDDNNMIYLHDPHRDEDDWDIIEIDQLGPDEVFIHIEDADGYEYKGTITGVMK